MWIYDKVYKKNNKWRQFWVGKQTTAVNSLFSPPRHTNRLKGKFHSVQTTTTLCGRSPAPLRTVCDVTDALLDDKTLSAVVTAFELCFSCALFRDDGNDDDIALFLMVNSHPITSSATRFYSYPSSDVKARNYVR
jgi:hypothetical protein